MRQFDAIITGAGQAGSPLAHRLADEGWQVALIERNRLGGSCLNNGCTPTKEMLASVQAAQAARSASCHGGETGEMRVDLPKGVVRKDQIVQAWRQGHQDRIDQRPSSPVFRGTGHFVGSHTVEVNHQPDKRPHLHQHGDAAGDSSD